MIQYESVYAWHHGRVVAMFMFPVLSSVTGLSTQPPRLEAGQSYGVRLSCLMLSEAGSVQFPSPLHTINTLRREDTCVETRETRVIMCFNV